METIFGYSTYFSTFFLKSGSFFQGSGGQ